MSESQPIICPICQHANPPGTVRCAKCSVHLLADVQTIDVEDVIPQSVKDSLPVTVPQQLPTDVMDDWIVLYIAGEVKPLILHGRQSVTLGRQINGEPADVIDMTPYHGHLLGVSRRHVTLFRGEDGLYRVRDLGSTNGSWLNEKRLKPDEVVEVPNGEQLRLGQLIMFVHFSSKLQHQKIRLTVTGTSTMRLGEENLTVPYLTGHVSTYLDAILGLQHAVNTLLKQAIVQPSVQSLTASGEHTTVAVDLIGASDAVRLVRQILLPWRRKHRHVVAGLRSQMQGRTAGPQKQPASRSPGFVDRRRAGYDGGLPAGGAGPD
jgi:pSer/pThr/pTyr-binding forkhead associated (FHA) protein